VSQDSRANRVLCSEDENLSRTPVEYNVAYFVPDDSIVPRVEYVLILHRLLEVQNACPGLGTPDSPPQRVGASPIGRSVEVRRSKPSLSLRNAFREYDVAAFDQRIVDPLESGRTDPERVVLGRPQPRRDDCRHSLPIRQSVSSKRSTRRPPLAARSRS